MHLEEKSGELGRTQRTLSHGSKEDSVLEWLKGIVLEEAAGLKGLFKEKKKEPVSYMPNSVFIVD